MRGSATHWFAFDVADPGRKRSAPKVWLAVDDGGDGSGEFKDGTGEACEVASGGAVEHAPVLKNGKLVQRSVEVTGDHSFMLGDPAQSGGADGDFGGLPDGGCDNFVRHPEAPWLTGATKVISGELQARAKVARLFNRSVGEQSGIERGESDS